MNTLADMVMRSDGLTHPLDLGATWLLRELETQKSIVIFDCEVVMSFLYTPAREKLEGIQGYTYCSSGVSSLPPFGFIASKRSDLVMIFNEFDRRCVLGHLSPTTACRAFCSRSWSTRSAFPISDSFGCWNLLSRLCCTTRTSRRSWLLIATSIRRS